MSQLHGEVVLIFLEAVMLTVPVSVIALAWYRRAVARNMNLQRAPGLTEPSAIAAKTEDRSTVGVPPQATETTAASRLIAIYVTAGLAGAAVMTEVFLFDADFDITALHWFVVLYGYAWAIVPTVATLAVLSRKGTVLAYLNYFVVGIASILIWSAWSRFVFDRATVSPLANVLYFLQFLLMTASVPYVVILLTGNRRFRPVAPLVLAVLLVFGLGAHISWQLLVRGYDSLWAARLLTPVVIQLEYVWLLLGSLPVGYVCWRLLGWLAGRHEAKRMSDVQLLVDAWWLIVVMDYTLTRIAGIGPAGLWGLLAFAAYRVVVAAGLMLWPIDSQR